MQMVNACTIPSKFLHLKYLHIALSGINIFPSYDYFSLVSFLDAAPSLETFILDVRATSHPTNESSDFGESINSSILDFSFSGDVEAHGEWLNFCRILTSKADARTPSWQPSECEDHLFPLCKELGWANMSYSQEYVCWVPYIGHHMWFIYVFYQHN